jgi:hypothetical protein
VVAEEKQNSLIQSGISTMFDYLKAGFSKFPADYFNRPFSLAAEDISDLWNSGHQCIHARPEADIMLDCLLSKEVL